jgi:phosphoserine phosphatase RsbU/P
MTILVADDHEMNRKLLVAILGAEGYIVHEASNGGEALDFLARNAEPLVALIDWQMPIHTGPEICRMARAMPGARLQHLILVTARRGTEDIVEGLGTGAHDYVTKPFDAAELLARVRIGCEMVKLQHSLADRVKALEAALAEIKQLKGLLPMCCYCKSVRDDKNYWQEVENYLLSQADVKVSHGVCPACFERLVRPQLLALGITAAEIDSAQPPPTGQP